MLLAIIEEENSRTEIYIEEQKGRKKLAGFCIKENKIYPLTREKLEILNFLFLSSNYKKEKEYNGYQTILDLNTGLWHFFKNGIEDFTKFCACNGQKTLMCEETKEEKKSKNCKWKSPLFYHFMINGASLIILASALLAIKENKGHLLLEEEVINLPTFLSYAHDESENFEKEIKKEDIKHYIATSKNLNEEEKAFLWNENLIKDCLPFYQDSFSLIVKMRHHNLSITGKGNFDENSSGYYDFGNTLYVEGYSPEALEKDRNIQNITAHEYIHLLQCYTPYYLIKEASAEIIGAEYYRNRTEEMAYKEAVKYTKILMEIIGTNPIWETNFESNSTALEEAISPYLNEEETIELLNILKLHPLHDKEKLEASSPRLEELLNILYENKWNIKLNENPMINAIINDREYYRAYFNQELINKEPSYCITNEYTMNIETAAKQDIIRLIRMIAVSEEDYKRLASLEKQKEKNIYLCDEMLASSYNDETDEWSFIMKNQETITLTEQSEKMVYVLLPNELFIQNKYAPDDIELKEEYKKNYEIKDYSLEEMQITIGEKYFVPSIEENFENYKKTVIQRKKVFENKKG